MCYYWSLLEIWNKCGLDVPCKLGFSGPVTEDFKQKVPN